MSKMINVTIDDQQYEVEEGKTVLDICEDLGIKIPTFCYHKSLTPYGACRLCLVEAGTEKRMKVTASCTYPSWEGMVVRTNTERVQQNRRIMAELMLARCPDAESVRKMAAQIGVTETRFPKMDEKCTLCGLCVRVCSEVVGRSAINFAKRGVERRVQTPFEEIAEVCIGCGACAYLCPNNAIKIESAD